MSKLLKSRVRLNEGYEDRIKNFDLLDAINKDVEDSEESKREYNQNNKKAAQIDYFANAGTRFLSKKLHGLTLKIEAKNIYESEATPSGEVVAENEDYITYLANHSDDADDYYYIIDDENKEIENQAVVLPNKSEYRAVPENLFEILIETAKKYAQDNSGLFKVVKILTPDNIKESKKETSSKKLNEANFFGKCAIVKYDSNLDEFELSAYRDFESAYAAMEFEFKRSGEHGSLLGDCAFMNFGGNEVAMQIINLSVEKGYILIKYDIEESQFYIESFEGASSARNAMEIDFEECGGNPRRDEINGRTAKIDERFMWEIVQNQ